MLANAGFVGGKKAPLATAKRRPEVFTLMPTSVVTGSSANEAFLLGWDSC